MISEQSLNWYRRFRIFGVACIIIVYLVILAGSIVRSTGSGMGCPDWPKCFGRWIPPTEESQLPPNYQEIYNTHGEGIEPFNAAKTWTEYLNRLLGALSGIFLMAFLFVAFQGRKFDATAFRFAFFSFLTIVLIGWIGAKVVSTNLKPVIITLHMVLALVLVFLLLYAVFFSDLANREQLPADVKKISWILLFGMILQILGGTQVREAVDIIAKHYQFTERERWIAELGIPFYIHRTSSLVILGLAIYQHQKLKQTNWARYSMSILLVIAMLILGGIIMAYFAIPAVIQPIHLLLSFVMIGLQFRITAVNLRSSLPTAYAS